MKNKANSFEERQRLVHAAMTMRILESATYAEINRALGRGNSYQTIFWSDSPLYGSFSWLRDRWLKDRKLSHASIQKRHPIAAKEA